jgi:DNA-binding GntR family transcriptional regulator
VTLPAQPGAVGGPASLRDRVYLELRGKLMAGEIDIRGRLVESQVCAALNVSRTPLREALVRLHADGLLERRPDGYYPVLPDLASVRDLYELRITLELHAVTRILENDELRYDKDLLDALRDDWRRIRDDPPAPSPDVVLLDEAYHTELATASGNLALVEALVRVNQRIRLVRMYDFLTPERIAITIDEHLRIVELLTAGELEAGRAALLEHINASFGAVETAVHAVTARLLGRRV